MVQLMSLNEEVLGISKPFGVSVQHTKNFIAEMYENGNVGQSILHSLISYVGHALCTYAY